MSNLDATLREQMRLELKLLQDRLRFTAIYVTHDQSEAFALADTIIIMSVRGAPALGRRDRQDRQDSCRAMGHICQARLSRHAARSRLIKTPDRISERPPRGRFFNNVIVALHQMGRRLIPDNYPPVRDFKAKSSGDNIPLGGFVCLVSREGRGP
jgi:energy-coupling factor transporter ATP-binding protein EcfA2